METIQIHVSVELNLSQDVKSFITSVVSNFVTAAPAPKSIAPAPTAPASAAPTPAPAPTAPTPATTTSAAPKKPVAPAPTAPTIEQVRQALAAKVNGHREEIKTKLNSFGAPSVTKLDPAKYSEMLEFLLTLS